MNILKIVGVGLKCRESTSITGTYGGLIVSVFTLMKLVVLIGSVFVEAVTALVSVIEDEVEDLFDAVVCEGWAGVDVDARDPTCVEPSILITILVLEHFATLRFLPLKYLHFLELLL